MAVVGFRMTELERARAHLRKRQRVLDMVRGMSEPPSNVLADAENGVLAALSWVWFEQEMVMANCRPRWAGIRSYSYEHRRLS